jgi:hypothetical protein
MGQSDVSIGDMISSTLSHLTKGEVSGVPPQADSVSGFSTSTPSYETTPKWHSFFFD